MGSFETAAAPPTPSLGSTLGDYAANLPQLLKAAQATGPGFAQLEQDIQRQFAPLTEGLAESLAGQAQEGMNSPLPDDLKQQFLDIRRAQQGTNVGSPIGASDIGRGLLGLQEQRQSQFRNLALSLTGRTPVATGAQQFGQFGLNPGQALGFAQGNFGTQANIFGTQQSALTAQRGQNLSFVSDVVGGLAGGAGAAIGSSITLKQDVKPINNALDKVDKLEGVLFNWKATKDSDGGVIAEQVEEVLPEAVININGIKHIKPMMIMGYLIEAIKELRRA